MPNLYPAVAVGLVVALASATWAGEKQASPLASIASWLALLCAVASYVLELRRDPVTAAKLALVLSLFVAIFGVGGVVAGASATDSPVTTVVFLAAPAVVVIGWIAWMQWGRERSPNPIRSKFGANAGEERGVQMAVAAPHAIRTGEVTGIDVYVQNAWDSPRTALVTVGVLGHARSVAPPAVEVPLDPLATVVVSVPFAVTESEDSCVKVAAVLVVKGAGGRRRRLWRAPFSAGLLRRARSNEEAAALSRGLLGGMSSRVSVAGAPARAPELPQVLTRRI
jgi:hypothetical protein